MARINLLPWRADRRTQRQKEFLVTLGASALGAALLAFLIVNFYNRQIDGQNDRNQFLQQKITDVQKKIDEIAALDDKKASLLKRKEIIEDLQSDRSQMVHLFDSLVRTIPDGVVLTSVKQEGDKLTLDGRSQSNARVSAYMRSLEGAGWMTRPQLSIIEAKEGDVGLPFMFSLSVTLANPNAPADADGDGVPDAAPAATAPAPNTAGVTP